MMRPRRLEHSSWLITVLALALLARLLLLLYSFLISKQPHTPQASSDQSQPTIPHSVVER